MKIALSIALTVFSLSLFSISSAAQNSGQAAYRLSISTDDGSSFNRPRIIKPEERRHAKVSTDQNSPEIEKYEHKIFDAINKKRAEQNLPPLVWSDEVEKIARLHSQNMASYNFFSHAGLDGTMVSDRADQFGISKWRAIGENIAYNQGFKDPLNCAVNGWMNSQGHRENLLNDRWKESAVGIAVTEDGTYYFTQVFLLRR